MNKSAVFLFVIIGAMIILGFASSFDGINDEVFVNQIVEGIQHVISASEDAKNALAEVEQEPRLNHFEELGYPDDYDPTNPVSNGEFSEDDWDAIQQEEAMEGLAEDAMNSYYQEKPDISDEVLKP